MDIREGISIIKEHSGEQKRAFIDFCSPVFVIILAGWNVLTSIFNVEHKFVFH